MRIAVIGAGGIGGHLAVRLAEAGNEVSVLARGAHLAAIRKRGLTLKSPAGDGHATFAAASDEGADLPPADLVIFAVKAQDLDGAMEAAAPLMAGEEALALPMLNGVEATGRLAARFGEDRALIGIARLSAFISEPGVVEHATPFASYLIGTAGGGQSAPRVAAIRQTFADAGIEVPDHPDLRVALWEKFVFLTALSGTTAGARCDAGTVASTPALTALFLDLAREVVRLAHAEGVPLSDGVAERSLEFMKTKLEPHVRASMAHDLAAGKPLEIDWLSGAVPRLGKRHGLAAPANATVAALLAPWRDGGAA